MPRDSYLHAKKIVDMTLGGLEVTRQALDPTRASRSE